MIRIVGLRIVGLFLAIVGAAVVGGGAGSDGRALAALEDPGPGLPTGLCRAWACSPVHEDAWRRFQTGAEIGDATLPMMYSGVCWMFGPGYDPNRRHHVGMLIDRFEDGTVAMGLQFSFFSKRQPFIAHDRTVARRMFDSTPMPIVFGDGYVFAESPRLQPFRYWVRRDGDDPEKLAMMGYFGFRNTWLCSLRDNASYR